MNIYYKGVVVCDSSMTGGIISTRPHTNNPAIDFTFEFHRFAKLCGTGATQTLDISIFMGGRAGQTQY